MDTKEDDLRELEQNGNPLESVTPMSPGEQDFFNQLEAEMKDSDPSKAANTTPGLPNFAPEFNPNGQAKPGTDTDGDSGNTGGGISGGVGQIPFKGGQSIGTSLAGAGVSGGALVAMKLAAMFAKRNKKGLLGGGAVIGVMIFVGIFSGSLALVNAKENAEEKLGSATQTSLDTMSGKMLNSLSWLATRKFKGIARAGANATRFANTLEQRGFTLGEGSLITPEGEKLVDSVDIRNRLDVELKSTDWGNRTRHAWRRGSKMDDLVEKMAISRANPVSRTNPVGKKWADAKTRMKARLRSMSIGGAEAAGKEITTAKETTREAIGADEADAAEKLGKDLVEDPELDPPESVSRLARIAGTEGGEKLGQKVTSLADSGALGKVSAVVDVSSILCRIGKVAVASYAAYYVVKKFDLIRVAGVFISAADAQILGDGASADDINEVVKILQNSPGGKTAMSSAGMQWLSGNNNVSLGSRYEDALSVNKQKVAGFLGMLIAAFSVATVKKTCDILTDTRTQAALAATEVAVQVVAAFFSGGTSTAATAGVKQGVAKQVAEAVGKSLAIAVASEVGASLGEQYVVSRLAESLGGTIASYAEDEYGETMGNVFAAGAGAFFEASGRSMGMGPLTKVAYLDLQKIAREEERKTLAQTSLYDRFLGIGVHNTRSLAARTLINSPIASATPGGVLSGAFAALTNISGTGQEVQKFASTALSGSAYAQDGGVLTDADGNVVDPFGSKIMGNNFSDIDIPALTGRLEASGDLTGEGEIPEDSSFAKFVDCSLLLDNTKDGNTTEVRDECSPSNAKDYQAYLALGTSVEGWDIATHPEDYVKGGAASSANSGSVDPTSDTSGIPCPAGTEDGGVQQDYGPNKVPAARIRICGIPGAIPAGSGVNSSAAANALAMINKAKTDGITLTGSAFRSYDTQVQLRIDHGCADDALPSGSCHPPTARPGNSMHEVGLAIDFSSYSFSWLSQNAGSFGFKNLPSESWHWSVNGN